MLNAHRSVLVVVVAAAATVVAVVMKYFKEINSNYNFKIFD